MRDPPRWPAEVGAAVDRLWRRRVMVRLQRFTSRRFTMGRRLCAAVTMAAAMLMFAGTAQAAQHTTVTETNHIHGAYADPNLDAYPCKGAPVADCSPFAK